MKKIISLLLALTVASSAAVSLTGCKLLDRLNEGETLRVILLGEKPADFATVEAELNKIIEPELGMKVTFEFFDPASMGEKMKLKMAEKDTFDITWTGYCNAYQTAVQMKGLYDITDLLDNIKMKDGSTVKMSDVVDQSYIDSAKVKNRVYGIPCIQVTSNPRCYTIFSSVAEECNIDVEGMQEAALNVTDYDSYAEYLKKITAEKAKVKAKRPDLRQSFEIARACTIYETLEGGVALKKDGSRELVILDETPEMQLTFQTLWEWYRDGYTPKDAATRITQVASAEDKKQQAWFESTYKPGQEITDEKTYGEPMKYAFMCQPYMGRTNPLATMLSVGANTKHPEEAVKFLYMLNSNKELYNMLCFGLEDKHYTKNEDGTISLIPDSGYDGMPTKAWAMGNQFNAYVMEGQPLDVWELTEKMNQESQKSPALGFVPDLSNLTTEVATVANVQAEYKAKRECGTNAPSEWYDEYIGKLKAAGIEKIRDELQKQYDEFLATK